MFSPPAIDPGAFDARLRERYDEAAKATLNTAIQVDSSGWDFSLGDGIDAAIDLILGQSATPLEQFMAIARQQRAHGEFNFFTKEEDINGQLRIEYTWNHGHEEALVIVRPTNSGGKPPVQTIDLNFDGYVAFFFSQNSQGGGTDPMSVDVYMNGFLMVKNVVLPIDTSSGLVFAFGGTSLRCQSILDPPINKPSTNPLAKKPGLAPQVLPGRGDNPVGEDPSGGNVAKWPQEFVYGLFGGNAWSHGQNPAQFLANVDLFGNITWVHWTDDPDFNIPRVQSGIAFSDAQKSPLNFAGMNYVTVTPSPGVTNVGEVQNQIAAVAEFYDRSQVRAVSQSWKDTDTSADILVNDAPLQWSATASNGAFGTPTITLGFDLTVGVKHKGSTTDSGFGADDCWVRPDGPPINDGAGGSGLSTAQQGVLTAYLNLVQDAQDAFDASQATLIDAASDALTAANSAQGNAFDDAVTSFEFWFGNNDDIRNALDAAFPTLSTFGATVTLLEDITAQGIINGIIGDPTLANYFVVLNAAGTAAAAALKAFEDAVNAEAPLPPAPPGLNTNIGGFDFQPIVVANGNWSIG